MSKVVTTSFTITNLHCASCVTVNERSLRKLPGVSSASVNFATGVATVTHDHGKVQPDMLRAAVHHNGYTTAPTDQTHDHQHGSDATTQRAAVQAITLSIPTVILAMAPLAAFRQPWSVWVQAVLASIVVGYIGREFHRGLLRELRNRAPGMDTLVSVGTIMSVAWSWWALLSNAGHLYFETGAVITTFVLIGRRLEAKSRGQAGAAIAELMHLGANVAHRIVDGTVHDIHVEHVEVGYRLQVKTGEKMPVDGIVRKGEASVDESMLTGESMPVTKRPGDTVFAATICIDSTIEIEATGVGADTMLSHIVAMVANAQTQKAPIQKIADKISGIFVPIVLVISAITLVGWMITGHTVATSIANAVAVLVIACPCALGLATPTAIMVGTGLGAKRGLLIKNGESLERAKNIDTVIFDKTGTLTEGRPQVMEVIPFNVEIAEVHRVAASIESLSAHPLATAITTAAKAAGVTLAEVHDFATIPGRGLSGRINGQLHYIGNIDYLQQQGIDVTPALGKIQHLQRQAQTTVGVATNTTLIGLIAIADTIKPSAREAVKLLRDGHIDVIMVTGDNQATAHAVAAQANITSVIAHVMPGDKAEVVKKLQQEGKRVVFVGDGINDAPALAQADLGVAIGTGTDVAIEAAHMVLVQGNPLKVVAGLKLAQRTFTVIRQNLFWAFVYNLIAVPIAAFGLLNPGIAAAAMALSSISVVGNSLRIARLSR